MARRKKAKKRSASKANPKRRHKRRTAKRKHAVASNPKRKHARRRHNAKASNPRRHSRRRNPGGKKMSPLMSAGLGILGGLAVGALTTAAAIKFAPTSQAARFGIAGLGVAGGLALATKHPALGAGIATGSACGAALAPVTQKVLNVLSPATTTQGYAAISGMQQDFAPRLGTVIAEDMRGMNMGAIYSQNMRGFAPGF